MLTPNENLDCMARMNTKTIGLTFAVSILAGAACFAANPQMGTWKLNEANSKITPGTMKNTHVVYSSMLWHVDIKSDGIDPSGKPIHGDWSGKFDGKGYPVTGVSHSDTRSYT